MNEQKKIIAAEINKERIESEAADLRRAADKLKKASSAYFADIDARKAVLAQQATDYQTQHDNLTAHRKALAAKIADMTSRGQIDEAASEYEKLDGMDREIAKVGRKLRLVQNAEVKGDPKLYNAARAAQDTVYAERTKYIETVRNMTATVEAEKKRLEAVERELKYARPECVGLASDDEYTKVDRHYRDLDRTQREAKEKAEAERAAAARNANTIYFG